ncbi:MAG TPA: hypothetical protein VFV01_31155 [Spirillospora sp.]|nr:hypothetical protein [Spirillospora sp.]
MLTTTFLVVPVLAFPGVKTIVPLPWIGAVPGLRLRHRTTDCQQPPAISNAPSPTKTRPFFRVPASI